MSRSRAGSRRHAPPAAPHPVRPAKESAPARPAPVWVDWAVRHGFWITLAAAVFTRLVHWLSVRAWDPLYAQTFAGFDMHNYWNWGQQIAEGDWLSRKATNNGAFYYGPLYPYFLAVIFKIYGVSYGAVHGAQALLGMLAPVLLWSAARRMFGAGAALATGLLTALCAPLLFYEQVLLMEGLLTAIHAGILYCLARGGTASERTGWRWGLGAGMLSGVACWGRGNFLLAIPLLGVVWGMFALSATSRSGKTPAAALLSSQSESNPDPQPAGAPEGFPARRPRPWRLAGIQAAAYLLGAAMMLGVTFGRNVHVSGRRVLTTTNGPINIYIGNASDSTGTFSNPPSFDKLRNHHGDQHAVPWREELLKDIARNPTAFLQLMIRKTWLFWNSYDIADNVSYYANKRFSPLVRLSPSTWSVIVSLALLGMVATRRRWKEQIALYTYLLGFTLSIIVVFISGRFRIQVLLPLAIWGGAGLVEAVSLVWRGRWNGFALRATFVAVGVFALWPAWSPAARMNTPSNMTGVRLIRPNDYHTLALAYLKRGRLEPARELLEEGARVYPWFRGVVSRLAHLYVEDGKPAKALPAVEAYLRYFPNDVEVLLQQADALIRLGENSRAEEALQRLLKSDPQNEHAKALLSHLRKTP